MVWKADNHERCLMQVFESDRFVFQPDLVNAEMTHCSISAPVHPG